MGLRPKPNLGLEDPNNSRPNAAPKPNDSRHPLAGFPPARARPPTRSAQAWARTPGLRGFFSPPAIHIFHPTCWFVQHPLAVSSWYFSRAATASSQASFAPCTQPRHPCTSCCFLSSRHLCMVTHQSRPNPAGRPLPCTAQRTSFQTGGPRPHQLLQLGTTLLHVFLLAPGHSQQVTNLLHSIHLRSCMPLLHAPDRTRRFSAEQLQLKHLREALSPCLLAASAPHGQPCFNYTTVRHAKIASTSPRYTSSQVSDAAALLTAMHPCC